MSGQQPIVAEFQQIYILDNDDDEPERVEKANTVRTRQSSEEAPPTMAKRSASPDARFSPTPEEESSFESNDETLADELKPILTTEAEVQGTSSTAPLSLSTPAKKAQFDEKDA